MSKALYRTAAGVEILLDETTASRLFGLTLVAKPVEQKTKKTYSSKEGNK